MMGKSGEIGENPWGNLGNRWTSEITGKSWASCRLRFWAMDVGKADTEFSSEFRKKLDQNVDRS